MGGKGERAWYKERRGGSRVKATTTTTAAASHRSRAPTVGKRRGRLGRGEREVFERRRVFDCCSSCRATCTEAEGQKVGRLAEEALRSFCRGLFLYADAAKYGTERD